MENKITAVEWLEKNISLDMKPFELLEYFDKAKQMEMENLMDEYYRGYNDGYANGQMDLITD